MELQLHLHSDGLKILELTDLTLKKVLQLADYAGGTSFACSLAQPQALRLAPGVVKDIFHFQPQVKQFRHLFDSQSPFSEVFTDTVHPVALSLSLSVREGDSGFGLHPLTL